MKRQLCTLLFAAMILSPRTDILAFPPDNAAVLYYKYMVNFTRPDDALWDPLINAAKGDIEVNEKVQTYLEEKQTLITALKTASTISNCDWGLDYSEGLSMEMSHLAGMKNYAYFLLAEGQLNKQQGNFQEAADSCLASLRMAGHVGNETLISYLVGTAISALTYEAMGDVLSAMPPDAAFLTELERELKLPEYNVLEIRTPLLNESRYLADEILRMNQKKKEILSQLGTSEEYQKDIPLLLEADPDFLRRSADYYQNFFDQYIKNLDQPYPTALPSFDALKDKPQEDYKAGKKEAFATVILAPAVTKIYITDIRRRTQMNALFTAIELYQIYAKNRSLPKELPVDAPADLFSGRPFVYQITANGFVLRCNEKDRDKDKIQEYIFQIAK